MKYFRKIVAGAFVLAASLMFTNSVLADWVLDSNNSNLSYGSIKNSFIGESNTFKTISGSIDEDGHVNIDIDLSSIDTQLELRDQRMRDIVFKVAENASAKLTGDMNLEAHRDQEIGTSRIVEASISIELVGQEIDYDVMLLLTRLAENKVMVTPHGVIFLDVEDFDLAGAIETLKELAGLETIANVAPMSFYLTFEK